MRLSFSWQHSDDGLASRHLIPGLDPHLRLLRQVEVHARPEPDQPVPLAPRDPLAFREPADDAPRHVLGHLHALHAMSGVRFEQRRHLLVRQFFFSSRRRHTRWTGDWSSDVCSSDLGAEWWEAMAPELLGEREPITAR